MTTEVSLNSTSRPYVIHMALSVSRPVLKTLKRILERVHQVIMMMLRTAEIDMANSVAPSDFATFLTNVAWAIRSTYHTVLKAQSHMIKLRMHTLTNLRA